MSNMCDQRPLNPSSHLTTAFNAAQPVLSSHREGVAQAQRAHAKAAADAESACAVSHATLDAQNVSPTITPAVLNTPSLTLAVIPPCINASLSSSLLITPQAATSQAGIIPPSTAPHSDSRERGRI